MSTYELYAVKYGTMQNRQRKDNFLAPDPHDDASMPIDYFVWAAVSPERTVVIDTGFETADAEARGRTSIRTAAEGLAAIGIEAAVVEDVVVTHLHYDHIGGHEQFPAARFHLQEKEMQFATGPHMCAPVMNHPFTADQIAQMVHRVFEGRVAFYNCDRELAPGLSLHHVGGHTMGLQVLRVRTRRGWVVVASDAAHFYENMETVSPFPVVYNVGDMVRAYDRMKELAETPQHIVPGHDPLVMARYPAVSRDLDEVAVRLDAEPS